MMQEYHNNTIIENNFVDISLDEGTTKEDEEDIIFEKNNIVIRKENPVLVNQDQQQVSSICFKNFCLNFWTNNVLAEQTISVPSNQSIVIKYEKAQSINNIQSNFKKILQIDELDRKKMLDLESWNKNLENKRNFSSINNNNNNIEHQSMSNSVLYDKVNRNQVLNQTLNLIKCSSLTNNNTGNLSFNNINPTESNDSLRSIISEFDKTFRLSSVSSVSGTFSFNDDDDDDNQAYPIYKTSLI
jgi:hypothetical protein